MESDGLQNEGQIYKLLEDAKVPHIAPFACGNDLDGHTTVGHLYEGESWACESGKATISEYRHYRMTLGAVGKDLTLFDSTLEYTKAIADAIKGL